MREIVLDTETTGLDPFSGHRLVEIGCVELINHIRTGNHFHIYLNPERDMPREAENVHGLSAEFLKDKPLFSTVAASFLEFIGDSPLVIHNAGFDLKFLNAELDAQGLPQIEFTRAIDTVIMARKKFPGSPANLDALCKRFNVDTSTRTKHGALVDAELLAEVYLELLGGRQANLLGGAGDANRESRTMNPESPLAFSGHTDLPPRSFPPTSDELAAHKAAIDKVKNAIWASA